MFSSLSAASFYIFRGKVKTDSLLNFPHVWKRTKIKEGYEAVSEGGRNTWLGALSLTLKKDQWPV